MIYNIRDWIDDTSRHATIQTITSLSPGDELAFLCIDRNFFDLIDHNVGKEPRKFKKFFKNSYKIIYIHEHDLHDINGFNLHLEYNKDCWYPLNDNGILPDNDDFGRPLNVTHGHDYKNYPTNTRVGWRGPMVLISEIDMNDKYIYE